MIKNNEILNEEVDPRLIINQLRAENLQLRNQITLQTGNEQLTDSLTPDLIAR